MRPLAFVGILMAGLALVAGPAAGQGGAPSAGDVVWEQMPLIPYYGDPRLNAEALAFLPPEPGREGGPPFRLYSAGTDFLLFDPERATEPERYGLWVDVCHFGACRPIDIVATNAGTLVIANQGNNSRSTDGGATWEFNVVGEPYNVRVLFQPPTAARDASGRAPVVGSYGPAVWASYEDGAAGTWERRTSTEGFRAGGDVIAFGEVPPSSALPNGRLLAGVWNGITVSDDRGATWRPGEGAYGFAQFLGYGFTFVPESDHPYGGAVLAAVDDLEWGRDSTATIYRSEDGGATWARAHRFSPAALGLPNANRVELVTTPDGAVWAGVTHELGGLPTNRRAAVARSLDGGRTWVLVSAGVDLRRIYGLMVGPDDRLYAATAVGVWHTVGPAWAVASEDAPETAPASVGVSVWPNPSGGPVTVGLSLASPQIVRVSVVDPLGREVAVAFEGVASDGQRVGVDTAHWPVGSYMVRVEAEAGGASAGLTVVR